MIKLALKDLKLFFADRRSLMLTFIVPIALITLFAFAFGAAGGDDDESRAMTLVVADEDNTTDSKNVIAQLDSLVEFEVALKSAIEAENLVKEGDEAAVLIFHKGFADAITNGKTPSIEFKYDGAKEAEVGILKGSLIGNLMSIIGAKSISTNVLSKFDAEYPGMDPVTRQNIHEQISKNFTPEETKNQAESILISTPVIAEAENSPALVQSVAGTAIMMLLFAVVSIGASLLDEKQEGTLKRLLYSPLRSSNILFGKMLYANMICILQLTVMFLYAKLVFGLDIFSHIPSLILMIIATAFACSGFGVVLASFAKSRQQVQGLATLIVLVMSCIGGSMIPIFFMPEFMQKLSVFSVNYWGIQGFYDIFWRRLPLSDHLFLTRILVLFLIGLVLNLIALQMFKKNVLKLA